MADPISRLTPTSGFFSDDTVERISNNELPEVEVRKLAEQAVDEGIDSGDYKLDVGGLLSKGRSAIQAFAGANRISGNEARAATRSVVNSLTEAFRNPDVLLPALRQSALQVIPGGNMVNQGFQEFTPAQRPAPTPQQVPIQRVPQSQPQAPSQQPIDYSQFVPQGGNSILDSYANEPKAQQSAIAQADNERAALIQNQSAALAEQAAEGAARRDELRAQIEERQADILGEINSLKEESPSVDKYWASRSNFSKVLSALALGLGAFGGGENKAIQVINKAIDRDIQLQQQRIQNRRANTSAKAGVLGILRGRFSDEITEQNAARIALMDQVQLKLNDFSNRVKSAEKQAAIAGMIGKIEAQKQELQQGLVARAERQILLQGTEPLTRDKVAGLIASARTKEEKQDARFQAERAVYDDDRVTPGGFALNATPTEAKEFRVAQSTLTGATEAINRLKEISKGASLSDKTANVNLQQEARSLQRQLVGLLRLELFGPGVLQEFEQAEAKKIIADPTRLFTADSLSRLARGLGLSAETTSDRVLDTLQRSLESKLAAKAKTLGLPTYPGTLNALTGGRDSATIETSLGITDR